MSDKKIKVLTLGDMPLLPSGVGTQSRYVIQALLNSGKFQVISLGGAIEHPNYEPITTKEYGNDWVIFPVKGYGDHAMIRSIMAIHKPDILWFMTDPRYYEWLWEIENEIREKVPMVYYHVWDNYPYPMYNKIWYESNDYIASISKVTDDIVKNVAPDVWNKYIPHAVDTEIFRSYERNPQEINLLKQLREQQPVLKDKVVFFWNNRNARRKMVGSVMFWFKEFLDKVGHDKASLLMHTELDDPHGQPLGYLMESLGLHNGQVVFSTNKMPPQELAKLYNLCDCTLNIADAEGFGLATFESLACERPIIVNMTGGLQEQVTDGENWFGVGIKPSSKAVIGSQNVPYIYEDRVSKEDFIAALEKIFYMSKEERRKLGKAGREHVIKNYSFEKFNDTWVSEMLKIHEKCGSWDTRKNYVSWVCEEIK